MIRKSRKRTKHIRNLVLVSSLTAIVLIVSTYAWFIGTQTVSVSSFDIEIAAAESLLLSLNGENWNSTVSISKNTLDTDSYPGHKNSWGGDSGIFPVSTVGELDSTSSRMKIFEKASLTATNGGYRLLASQVDNSDTTDFEPDGYVVFDLFIKNISGHQYLPILNELDEEAIYLTQDSSVRVAASGVANTGIENSTRVAFAQIGRVIGTNADRDTITGITCASTTYDDDDDDGTDEVPLVTGICRTAQIWEPNDKNHVDAAAEWYTTQCLHRTGANVSLVSSYGGACNTVSNNNTYHTYATASPITSAHGVDVYDGSDYNGYTATTIVPKCTGGTVPTTKSSCLAAYGTWNEGTSTCSENNRAYCKAINGTYTETFGTCSVGDNPANTPPTSKTACEAAHGTWNEDSSTCNGGPEYCEWLGGTYSRATGKLDYYPYFTDTMKNLTGNDRPTFMTLSPNSITKVRVYVYIEGQDVDNYDFASVGKKIAVNFGFTKERYTESDINYDGPARTYKITFDADGGTPEPADQNLVTSIRATKPTVDPEKEGYTFQYWAIEKTVEETPQWVEYDFSTIVAENISLKAIYQEDTTD